MKTRQAVGGEDDQFLFEVYASTRETEMALWGWDQEAQQQFLKMQYSCQQGSYHMQYANLECKIIMVDNRKAGRMITALSSSEMVLVDIVLLPEFQNKGIGAVLLQQLQQEAAKDYLPLRLSILMGNPAQGLYERHGFKMSNDDGVYGIMKWKAEDNEEERNK